MEVWSLVRVGGHQEEEGRLALWVSGQLLGWVGSANDKGLSRMGQKEVMDS